MEKFMSGMLCVGGGVLLATVFIHMIPEVRESFETAKKAKKLNEHSHDEHEDEDEHEHRYITAYYLQYYFPKHTCLLSVYPSHLFACGEFSIHHAC